MIGGVVSAHLLAGSGPVSEVSALPHFSDLPEHGCHSRWGHKLGGFRVRVLDWGFRI